MHLKVDWEYPRNAQDGANYVILLREMRAALDTYARSTNDNKDRYLLTAAVPAGEDKYKLLRLNDMSTCLDFFYVMCYDFAGSWDSVAGHQANLLGGQFSCDKSIKYYIDAGVNPRKIVMGIRCMVI